MMLTLMRARLLLVFAAGLPLWLIGCGLIGGSHERIVFVPDAGAESIQLRIMFGAGSAFDPPGKEGLAYLTAATLTHDADARLAAISAQINVGVDREVGTIDGRCPADAWPEFARILTDMITRPSVGDEELGVLITAQLAGLNKLRSDHPRLAREALQYRIYRDHPYGHPPLGKDASLRSLTVADVEAFRAAHYTGSRFVIGFAGNVSESTVRAFFDTLSARLPMGEPAAPIPRPAPPGKLELYIIEAEDAEQATLQVGCNLNVIRGDSLFSALYLAGTSLGFRLAEALDARRGLSAITWSGIEPADSYAESEWLPSGRPRRHQYFFSEAYPQSVNAAFATYIILREIDRLGTERQAESDLIAARRHAIGQAERLQEASGRSMVTRLDDLWLGRQETHARLAEETGEVSGDRLRAACAGTIDPRHMVVVAVVPDGQQFATQLLANSLSYLYPPHVDKKQIRQDDFQYLSYMPAWHPDRTGIVRISEMFR